MDLSLIRFAPAVRSLLALVLVGVAVPAFAQPAPPAEPDAPMAEAEVADDDAVPMLLPRIVLPWSLIQDELTDEQVLEIAAIRAEYLRKKAEIDAWEREQVTSLLSEQQMEALQLAELRRAAEIRARAAERERLRGALEEARDASDE